MRAERVDLSIVVYVLGLSRFTFREKYDGHKQRLDYVPAFRAGSIFDGQQFTRLPRPRSATRRAFARDAKAQ